MQCTNYAKYIKISTGNLTLMPPLDCFYCR